MNADEVRNVGFRRGGYNASQVDDLLGRLAVEPDAGRPVRPLIANAAFRSGELRPRGYDIESVDWFLDQPRSREDRCDRAGTGADPWRDLAVANHFARSGPGLAEECAGAWRDFGQVSGTPLRWAWAGTTRRELRTAEQYTVASRYGSSNTFSVGGRTFTVKRVTGSSWPGGSEITDRHIRDFDGHFL